MILSIFGLKCFSPFYLMIENYYRYLEIHTTPFSSMEKNVFQLHICKSQSYADELTLTVRILTKGTKTFRWLNVISSRVSHPGIHLKFKALCCPIPPLSSDVLKIFAKEKASSQTDEESKRWTGILPRTTRTLTSPSHCKSFLHKSEAVPCKHQAILKLTIVCVLKLFAGPH